MHILRTGWTADEEQITDADEEQITDADEEQVGLLYSIDIKAIIDIYCTRGMEFSGSAFKKELKDLDLHLLIAIKLFVLLEEWRDRLDVPNIIMQPSSSSTSSSSSSSISNALSFT